MNPGSLLPDASWHAPEIPGEAVRAVTDVPTGVDLPLNGADAGLEGVSGASDLLSSLPDMAGSALEVIGDLAGDVFGLILEMICGILDGLSF